MDIYDERTSTNKTVHFNGTVDQLLTKLEINPETVIIIKDDEVLTEDETLDDKDKITILSVISGG